MAEPMFGVPKGEIRVENPDGVYQGLTHNLYDTTGCIPQPVVPGDFTVVKETYEPGERE